MKTALEKIWRGLCVAGAFVLRYSWAFLLLFFAAWLVVYLAARRAGGANVGAAIAATDEHVQDEAEDMHEIRDAGDEAEADVRAVAAGLKSIEKAARKNRNESMADLIAGVNDRLRGPS